MELYIDGQLIEAQEHHSVTSPATGLTVGVVTWATESHARAALEAADRALSSWAAAPAAERAEWMCALAAAVSADEERLRTLVHLETGKPWPETAEDHASLVDSLHYYAREIVQLEAPVLTDAQGGHRHRLEYGAVGVVGAFLAWNFPLLNLGFKLGPAMAAGCPIIVKPSPKAPLSAYAVGDLCARVGLPPGVVNILCGPDDVVGDAISSSPIPAMLTVIGSTETGRRVMRMGASSIKRYSMELGGNAPAIVFQDADLEEAARVIAGLKFTNAGQTCVAPNRVYVHREVAADFLTLVARRAASTTAGFGSRESVEMGPLIDRAAQKRVLALIGEAVAQGADVLVGGDIPPSADTRGAFVSPTVVTGVRAGMRLHDEEVFGPVVSVAEFDDEHDIIVRANDTSSGLAAYVFTRDPRRAEHVSRALEFGEVHVNGVKHAIDLPHLGIKQSGLGCDCSTLALHDYLSVKRVTEAVAS
jgi:succinate-semialdehyde dehydrogenase/glutarate-semialdehyde dehydrogenase